LQVGIERFLHLVAPRSFRLVSDFNRHSADTAFASRSARDQNAYQRS
jgi:hypothetical protein